MEKMVGRRRYQDIDDRLPPIIITLAEFPVQLTVLPKTIQAQTREKNGW